jgi:hypothetical protein
MDLKHHPPHGGKQNPSGLRSHPVLNNFRTCSLNLSSASEFVDCLPRSWKPISDFQIPSHSYSSASSSPSLKYLVILRNPIRVAISAAHFASPTGLANDDQVHGFVKEHLPTITTWQVLVMALTFFSHTHHHHHHQRILFYGSFLF